MRLNLSIEFGQWFLDLSGKQQTCVMQIVAIYNHFVDQKPNTVEDCTKRIEVLREVLEEKPSDLVDKVLVQVLQALLNEISTAKLHVEWDIESLDYVVVSDHIDEIIESNGFSRGSK
jgi:CRISPR/Cas system endoribonuclease Cas6 (RAMP superfamily)